MTDQVGRHNLRPAGWRSRSLLIAATVALMLGGAATAGEQSEDHGRRGDEGRGDQGRGGRGHVDQDRGDQGRGDSSRGRGGPTSQPATPSNPMAARPGFERPRGDDHGGQAQGERSRPAPVWHGYDGQDAHRGEPYRGDRRGFGQNYRSDRRYDDGRYRRPEGWYSHRWGYGEILPGLFWSDRYWINDYWQFGLSPAPYGYVWVRNGPDALLIDRFTGAIAQVVYGAFY